MRNGMKRSRINIVIGSTIFLRDRPRALEGFRQAPYVAYQLEQLSDRHGLTVGNAAYHAFLAGAAAIWEYAPANLAYLRGTPLWEKTAFLPPGWAPSLEKFAPSPEPDIDVLFYGSTSPRRYRMIQRLREAGVNAHSLFGAYGPPLHDQLRRARIILNLHGAEGLAVLETVRLSFLLANRCFVVSEPAEYNPYGDGLVFAPYEEIIETCRHWLAEGPARRRAVAERGYAAGRAVDMAAGLAEALSRLPYDRFPAGAL
jgi:hypothetical protein